MQRPGAIGATVFFPPLALAPLAGVTNTPFRLLCRELGAALVWTEMISSAALVRRHRGTLEASLILPEERPAAAQIFGNDPAEMAEAAEFLSEAGADLVDINMACPVRKILKSGGGVALMREPHLAEEIVRRAALVSRAPVTVKIRLGWSEEEANYLEFGRRMVGAGASAVILHPRTRAQHFAGRARWEAIGRLVETLPVPVIGSGDVRSGEDALALLSSTGCEAVMVGRAVLGRPWILSGIARALGDPRPFPGETGRREVITRHLSLILGHCPGRAALPHLRKHLAWYSRGLPNGAAFRSRVGRLPDAEALIAAACAFFRLEEGEVPCPSAA